jgi:hypothetical protein
MTLEIKRKSNSILLIHYSPEYSSSIFGLGLLLVFTVFCLIKGSILSLFGIIIVILFIWLIVIIVRERELWCVINRKTGVIAYKKGGILGAKYNIQNAQYNVTEIIALEVERYATHRRDTFQIRLALTGNRTLPLSSANLDFYEYQSCANDIHQFIGIDISLRVID